MKRPSAPAPRKRTVAPSAPSAASGREAAKRPASPTIRSEVQSKARVVAEQLATQRRRAAWLNGFRFSAFSLVMAGILTIGVLSLIPRIQELVVQRQQIAALQSDINQAKATMAAQEAERQQWNDPTFIETQARERLYFVQPGDVSYLVINDLTPGQLTLPSAHEATGAVEQTQSHWLGNLLSSVWGAGAAPVAPSTAPSQGAQ
ncbi:MAG TPA: septum formation initiator family protein [Microbacteriaceae bacterium]|nr:septum formation initiator family protein [Microbacteriaceae bacterium]